MKKVALAITIAFTPNIVKIDGVTHQMIDGGITKITAFVFVTIAFAQKFNKKGYFLNDSKITKTVLKVITIFLVITILILLITIKQVEIMILGISVLGGILLIICGYIYLLKKISSHVDGINIQNKALIYYKEYKNIVIGELLKGINNTIQYTANKGIDVNKYLQAKFEYFDTFSSEDYLTGKINNAINFEMAEVQTQRMHKNSRGNTYYENLFMGLFMVSELPKDLNCEIRILTDKGLVKAKNRIELDTGEFEKYYDVFGDNKIKVLQILTSSVMEKLIDFMKEMKVKYEISIRNDKLYIRFKTGGLFEPESIYKPSLDVTKLHRYYKLTKFSFDISEELIKIIDNTQI